MESELTLSVDDLKGEIGTFLGYGRGEPFGEGAWDEVQTNDIVSILKSCIEFVKTPPPLVPGGPVHNWSFMRPFGDLTFVQGNHVAQCPDDFGGIEGGIFLQGDTANKYIPLSLVNPGVVDNHLSAYQSTTGPPQLIAERVTKETTPISSNRSELVVWPIPDRDYTVRFQYYFHPNMLNGLSRYPPGASAHSGLYKAAALAAAELFKDNERGPMWVHFMDRLAASIGVDRKRKPHRLRYNGDWTECDGDARDGRDYQRRYGQGHPLLVQGVEYGD